MTGESVGWRHLRHGSSCHVMLALDLLTSPTSSVDRSGAEIPVRPSLPDETADPFVMEVRSIFTIGEGIG